MGGGCIGVGVPDAGTAVAGTTLVEARLAVGRGVGVSEVWAVTAVVGSRSAIEKSVSGDCEEGSDQQLTITIATMEMAIE